MLSGGARMDLCVMHRMSCARITALLLTSTLPHDCGQRLSDSCDAILLLLCKEQRAQHLFACLGFREQRPFGAITAEVFEVRGVQAIHYPRMTRYQLSADPSFIRTLAAIEP